MLEPSRKLAAHVTTRSELLALVEATLNGDLAIVTLDRRPPGRARYPIDVYAPGLSAPIQLVAQLAGEPTEGGYPVILMASSARQTEHLRELADALRRGESAMAPRANPSPSGPTAPRRGSEKITPAASGSFSVASRGQELEDPLLGRALAGGRYRMSRLIGVGGMGRVYGAKQTALSKDIAIKVLDARFANDAHFAARFQREALAASTLDHRNVMRVFDFGQEPDGLLFIAMELLDGESLADILEREHKLTVPRALGIIAQVCAALGAAHERGVVHRDVKPENIVIERRTDDDGRPIELVKVCDFGLAKTSGEEPAAAESTDRRRKLTADGAVMGTPDYMAPEQCRGEPADARSDIYACGVILFEMCTGRVPFEAENSMRVLSMHLMSDPPRPTEYEPTLDHRVEALILRTLAKDPARRPQSARELRDELRVIVAGSKGTPAGVPIARVALSSAAPSRVATPPPWSIPPTSGSGSHRLDGLAREIDFGDPPDEVRPSMIPVDLERAPDSMRRRAGATPTTSPPLSADVDALASEARHLLDTDPERQKRAYWALLRSGVAGYWALERARIGKQLENDARQRWRTTILALDKQGAAAIPESLSHLDIDHPRGLDVPFAEDLLSSLSGPHDPSVLAQVERFLQHPSARLRRAALAALVKMNPPTLASALLLSLEDQDPGVRLIATRAYGKQGGVGPNEVVRLARILDDTAAPDDVRASAAVALARVEARGQAEAELVLLNAVQGRSSSFIAKLGGSVPREDGPLFLEAAARALLKLGGPGVKPVIQKRARSCQGDARNRLERVLNGR